MSNVAALQQPQNMGGDVLEFEDSRVGSCSLAHSFWTGAFWSLLHCPTIFRLVEPKIPNHETIV